MNIQFWGVRGSLPTQKLKDNYYDKINNLVDYIKRNPNTTAENIAMKLKLDKFIGSNTPCVSIKFPHLPKDIFILDSGSGIKELGEKIIKDKKITTIHLFISHTHHDHVNGFPFFTPAYSPKYKIVIYSPISNLQQRFSTLQQKEFFPIQLENLQANIEFVTIDKSFLIQDINIDFRKNFHPGDSWSYKITHNSKSMAYMTDIEINLDNICQESGQLKTYLKDVDTLIFDAQYTFMQSFIGHSPRYGWGHSSGVLGVDIAFENRIKNLILFHFDPNHTDKTINKNLSLAKRLVKDRKYDFPKKVINSYEGLTINIK